MRRTLLLLFTVVILFTTCKKFPEDPFISLNTVKSRLAGTWKIDYIKYNGADVTESYNDTVQPKLLKDLFFHYKFDRRSSNSGNPIVNDFGDYDGYLLTYFEIKNKKIYFKDNIHLKLNNLFLSSSYFDIKRLYKKIFKINNANYEIQFNKISDK